jgi:hypothetical protein
VVEVDVDDRDPAEPAQRPGGDGGVVQQAEAAVVAGPGVVAGRAAKGVGGRGALGDQVGAGAPVRPRPLQEAEQGWSALMWTWTAIWTLLAFVLLLVHADTILAFAAEQLDQRRAHRLRLEQERTKQALVAPQCDELIWRQLNGPDPHQDVPADHA